MQCELCDKSYERRAWLARHMQDAHGARLPGSPADLDDVPGPFTDAAATYEGTNTAWMVAQLDSPQPVSWVQPSDDQTTRIRNLRRSGVAFPEAYESVMGVVPPPEVIATYTAPAVNRLDGMAERVRAGRAPTSDVLYLYRLALIGRDAIAQLRLVRNDEHDVDPSTDIDPLIDRWEAADQ